MALKTLDVFGPLRGYRIVRRIEEISTCSRSTKRACIPGPLKVEREG
jgi:hypothetical protein